MSPEAFGRAFVEEHLGAYRVPVTQALIQTSRLPVFRAKVNDFAAGLLPLLAANHAQFDLARSQSQTYAYSYYHDLYDLAARVKSANSDPSVASAADAVMNDMAGANGGPVIAESHSATSVDRSHGLSIYLPASGQYASTSTALVGGSTYADLQFTKDYPKWGELIRPSP